MTKITFVRHGETELNRDRVMQGRIDSILNQRGIEQAKLSAYYFMKINYDFTYCYSSPLKRAVETAEYILKTMKKKLPIEKLDALIERDYGQFQGLPINEEYFYHIYEDRAGSYERNKEIQERIVKVVGELCAKHDGEHLLLIGHSHTMKAIMTTINPDFDWHTILGNGSYFDLEYHDGEYKITNFCTDTSDY